MNTTYFTQKNLEKKKKKSIAIETAWFLLVAPLFVSSIHLFSAAPL